MIDYAEYLNAGDLFLYHLFCNLSAEKKIDAIRQTNPLDAWFSAYTKGYTEAAKDRGITLTKLPDERVNMFISNVLFEEPSEVLRRQLGKAIVANGGGKVRVAGKSSRNGKILKFRIPNGIR